MKILPLILALLAALPSCAREREVSSVSDTALLLDTTVTVTIYGQDDIARNAISAAFTEIGRLEDLLSADVDGNDLDILRQNAGKKYVKVDSEVLYVIKEALYYAELTGGAFDPTIGPLVSLWNISGGTGYVPADGEREAAMALVDYKELLINDSGEVMLAREGMSIDLGAIAKGYIADRVKALLLGLGVKHAIINLGGNVLTVGGKADDTPFNIGIQDPKQKTNVIIASMEATDKSLVSSGSYERYFVQDGVRYHHILDPATGAPSNSGLAGVTIISDVSIDGDALSTAVFILGKEKGLALVESLGGVECILVDEDDNVTVSPGLDGKLTFY